MNFEIKNGNNFHISLNETKMEQDVILLHIHADAKGRADTGGRRIASIEKATTEIVLVNSSLDDHILIDMVDSEGMGNYECAVYDCCGEEVYREELRLQELTKISKVPINGTVYLIAK